MGTPVVRPYDPIPDIALLLRVLEWSRPVSGGHPPRGSSHEILDQICEGLGIIGSQAALEYEKALYRQLSMLAEAPDGWHQRFIMREGVIACASCEVTMMDGTLAHTAECPALLRGVAMR